MMPDMGYHLLNPSIQGFDVTKPHILVYERRGGSWTLGALEWVFPSTPTTPPLPGATYGSCSRPRRTSAPGAAPRPAPPSTSGTRTW
jgi:hypothetical protein